MIELPPPIVQPPGLVPALLESGHAVLGPAGFATFAGTSLAELDALAPTWSDLPPDEYLKDGGRYRRRRHASFVSSASRGMEQVPQRAHWQPVEYNALHGGFERWFEPVAGAVVASIAWQRVLGALARLADDVRGRRDSWYVEAHQFRIDTEGGIGRPTPEGAHRDGVDLVAVVLVSRVGIKGGETRVFDAAGPAGERFTMTEPWTCIFLDDARVIHESTPIQPVADHGWRDTLVITLRSGGFQGPGA